MPDMTDVNAVTPTSPFRSAIGPKTIRLERFIVRLWHEFKRLTGLTHQIYINDRGGEYRNIWRAVAASAGADFDLLDGGIGRISKNGKSCLVANFLLPLDNPAVLTLCGSKPLVHKLLRQANLPVPDHVAFDINSISRAEELLARHPNSIVVKPAAGYAGKGVTTHITSRKGVRRAAITASMYNRQLLAEEQIAGECYRLLVFRGNVIAAARRTGVRIVGDGESTIRELAGNSDDLAGISDIDDDPDILFTLKAQGHSLDSVAPAQADVLVRSTQCSRREVERPELRTVYDCEVIDSISPEILATARQAAEVVGSELLGVDIIATDVSGSLSACGGVINEVNTTPGLHHHYDITKDDYPACAYEIIEALLRDS